MESKPKARRILKLGLLLASAALLLLFGPRWWQFWQGQKALRGLRSDDPVVVAAAGQALVGMGTSALDLLLVEMASGECPVRSEVARIAREIDADEAIARLATDLGSPDPARRCEAVRLLGVLEAPAAAVPVRPLLADEDPEVFRQAVITLSFLGATAVLPELRRLLVEGHAFQRSWAAYGLGYLGDTASVSLLVRAAESDPGPEVRYQALQALQRLDSVPAGLAGPGGLDAMVEGGDSG